MLRFDKSTYLSLHFKFILSEGLSMRIRCYTILRIHRYIIQSVLLVY